MHDTLEDLIQSWDLIDIKPKLGHFTWSNHRVGATNVSASLDQFLVHYQLIEGKSIVSLKILPKLLSYHHPISLLFENEENLGPTSFRFSPLWIDRIGFMDVVTQAWSQYIVGSPSFVWEKKLKNKKYALKKWEKNSFYTPTSSRLDKVIELS